MITFSPITNPQNQSLEIPKQKSYSIIYNVHNNEGIIGRTYGSTFGVVDIFFPNHVARRYKIEEFKKYQKRNLSCEALVTLGTKLS